MFARRMLNSYACLSPVDGMGGMAAGMAFPRAFSFK